MWVREGNFQKEWSVNPAFWEVHTLFRTGEEYPKGRRGYNITLSENEIKSGVPIKRMLSVLWGFILGPRQITVGDLTGQKKRRFRGGVFVGV